MTRTRAQFEADIKLMTDTALARTLFPSNTAVIF